jgi:hypothetical protein
MLFFQSFAEKNAAGSVAAAFMPKQLAPFGVNH